MIEVTESSKAAGRSAGGDTWWGKFSLDVDHAGQWRVGPRTVWIERHELEWRITHWQQGDPMEAKTEINVPTSLVRKSIPHDVPIEVARYSFEATEASLEIRPALADRPVVVRPEEPLFVLSGETVTLFVSTPLWLQVFAGDDGQQLTEIPSYRPSDSWFGPNTREGEICYSTATLGRLRLESVPRRLHRAITPVVIRNRSGESLPIDRIRIPVTYLSLFEDRTGYLWTESTRFDKVPGNQLAALHIGKGAPTNAPGAQRISGPRESHDRSAFVRTFSSLIHRITDA